MAIERRFVIFTAARTGSNALVSSLAASSEIHCDYELFHPEQIYCTAGLTQKTIQQRNRDPKAFLDDLIQNASRHKPSARVYGFKIFFTHNRKAREYLLNDRSWAKVILRRENVLDQFISHKIAAGSEMWDTTNVAVKTVSRVRFVPAQFDLFVERLERQSSETRAFLQQTQQPFFEIGYSDVEANRYEPLCHYLQVQPTDNMAPRIGKQNKRQTALKLVNPEVARAHLATRGLGHLWVD